MKTRFLKLSGIRTAGQTAVAVAIIAGTANNVFPSVVTGKIVDTEGISTNTTVLFFPLSTPVSSSNRIIITTQKTLATDSNGKFSIWLEPGDYKITAGTNARDSFVISVPEGFSTNDWTTLITSALRYSFPYMPVYEEKRFRGTVNGYASLDAEGRVPRAQIGGGIYSSNAFLRGDGVWTNISASDIGSGQVSEIEFNTLDGIQSSIQSQLNQRILALNGFATNLFINGLTSAAESRFLPCARPTNLIEGSLWCDSYQKCHLMFQNGVVQSPVTTLFSSTNTTTYTNTTVETSIIPTGVGGLLLPANSISPGKSLAIRMRGIYSNPGTTATVVFKFKIGDSVFATPAFGYSTSQVNKPVYVEYNIAFTAVGTNGAYISGGQFGSQTFTYVFGSQTNPQNQTLVLDTTRDNQISITATHSRADVSLTISQLTIQTAF
ncbi:MAG: hypothetical protein N2487_04860 [Verrucomicrobiae bacterium]|nr:hypothetical protein [Verrucomicrobiae bacterium]